MCPDIPPAYLLRGNHTFSCCIILIVHKQMAQTDAMQYENSNCMELPPRVANVIAAYGVMAWGSRCTTQFYDDPSSWVITVYGRPQVCIRTGWAVMSTICIKRMHGCYTGSLNAPGEQQYDGFPPSRLHFISTCEGMDESNPGLGRPDVIWLSHYLRSGRAPVSITVPFRSVRYLRPSTFLLPLRDGLLHYARINGGDILGFVAVELYSRYGLSTPRTLLLRR